MSKYKVKHMSSVLNKKGFEENKKKDHIRYTLYYNGKKTSIYTYISHGLKEYGDDLIDPMKKQLRLNKKEFQDFFECPITKEIYINMMVERGHIRTTG